MLILEQSPGEHPVSEKKETRILRTTWEEQKALNNSLE